MFMRKNILKLASDDVHMFKYTGGLDGHLVVIYR